MTENFSTSASREDEEQGSVINLKEFFRQCLDKWYWFAASIVICLGIGLFYIMRSAPVYERSAMVQVRDDKHGAGMNNDFANTFADFGMFSSSADIFNELIAIKSPRLLTQVVDNLDLNVNYTTKSGLKTLPLYGQTLPFTVTFVDGGDNAMSLRLKSEAGASEGELSDFVLTLAGNKEEYDSRVTFNTSSIDTISTPIGRLLIRPNAKYITPAEPKPYDILVTYVSPASRVESLEQELNVALVEDNTTVINLSMLDKCPERADNILDNLIDVYNQSWVEDRNQMARATSHFINERLVSLEAELSDVDSDISSYKSRNLVPDVDEASALYLQQATKTGDEILEINNKLSMARYVRDYLDNPSNTTSIMPGNSGTGTTSIDNQINEYNKLMIERNALASSSSENHPRVRQYDASLAEMRAAVMTAIDNQIAALSTAMKNLQRSQDHATARIAANPTQAKYLLSVGREQKVKESLYLYLLQKREENELSQTFAPYNTRILKDATGPTRPVAPRKKVILAIALFMGILIPLGILYAMEMLNTKVRSRRDINDALTVPFLGELPYDGKVSKLKRTKDVEKGIVVGYGHSNAINEAFRLLRSGLEFMTRSEEDPAKVIMVTSAIPGSGKTFITMNLAATLALKGKKVLLVDLDLRRHSLSNQLAESSRQGVSGYLAGNADLSKLISHNIEGIDNLDLLTAGAVPPNPAELLGSPRFKAMIEYARDNYDVVLLDCPPTEPVVDARTITHYADMTLYVIRIGNLDRAFLPEIERMYREGRYNRMGIVLNGAPTSGAYSYRYGYNYNYNHSDKK